MKKYEAMVLSCIDPRFQAKVFNHLKRKKLTGKYSAFTIAGAAKIANKKKQFNSLIENKIHKESFVNLKKKLKKKHPNLKVSFKTLSM